MMDQVESLMMNLNQIQNFDEYLRGNDKYFTSVESGMDSIW